MSDPTRHVAFCPHCGNTAPQRVVLDHHYRTKWYDGDSEVQDDGFPLMETVVCICETCDAVLLYDGLESEETYVWPPRLCYPEGPELHASVPANVSRVYQEAHRIFRIAPNAFAVQIRRALEAICDDRGIKDGNNLAARLKALADTGQIPPMLAEITDFLRVLGNAGAHTGSKPVTAPQTWAMDDFFRVIIEYVYVAPSKLAEFRKKLHGAEGAK